MSTALPCEDNPDDWFIGRDGRQYVDDEFLTDDERKRIAKSVLRIEGESDEDHRDRVDAAIEAGERSRRRAEIVKRKEARASCYGCPVRLHCLDLGLSIEMPHGTWGGHFEEQIRAMQREIKQRRRRR